MAETDHRIRMLLVAAVILAQPATGEESESARYESALAEWRADRVAKLKGPDGWLNLAGCTG